MEFFRKKATKAKTAESPKTLEEPTHRRIITAEGWHRKILGKPTEVVPKKRGG